MQIVWMYDLFNEVSQEATMNLETFGAFQWIVVCVSTYIWIHEWIKVYALKYYYAELEYILHIYLQQVLEQRGFKKLAEIS